MKVGKNRLRNEKLGGYFYDLSKYAGTIIVIGKFVNPAIPWINFLGWRFYLSCFGNFRIFP